MNKPLPPDWEAIAPAIRFQYWNTKTLTVDEAITLAVERCYTLATKPPKELTDGEIAAVHTEWIKFDDKTDCCSLARAYIAAHIRKQSEPERVKFRAARNAGHNDISMFKMDADVASVGYEWLEPEQSFEVVLP